MTNRIIIAISGASCVHLGYEVLRALSLYSTKEVHLIVSDSAKRTLKEETNKTLQSLEDFAFVTHNVKDIGASIASGSFKTNGMLIVPCSMKTVSGIAHGYSDNLILRAADVTLKEKRRLVIVARESPLSLIHLRNLTLLAEYGAMIVPPMLAGYSQPKTIEDIQDHIIGKLFDCFDMVYPPFKRWKS